MIPITHQLTPAPKKLERRLTALQRVRDIYDRGAEAFPAEYLTCHQPGDPNAVHKYRALRKQKKLQKAAKRLSPSPRTSPHLDF